MHFKLEVMLLLYDKKMPIQYVKIMLVAKQSHAFCLKSYKYVNSFMK